MSDEEQEMGDFSEEGHEDTGPLGKVTNAFGMMCLGCLLFPCILGLLGWNEKRFVCDQKNIIFAEDNTEDLGTTMCLNPVGADANNGKFVYFSCPVNASALKTWSPASFNMDDSFASVFSFQSAAASQLTEIYQCVETVHSETRGSGKHTRTVQTYTYDMEWVTNHHDDDVFHHQAAHVQTNGCPGWQGSGIYVNVALDANNGAQLGTKTDHASQVRTGPFVIDEDLVNAFTTDTDVVVSAVWPAADPAFVSAPVASTTVLVKSSFRPDGNYMVTCYPTVSLNCMRISYRKNGATDVSVMAKIGAGGITAKETMPSSWACSGGAWSRIATQKKTKIEFVDDLHASNSSVTWILRIIGVLGAWAAVYCCLAPISAAADLLGDCLNFIPCVGGLMESLVEGVVTVVLCLMSCMCGCSAALTVIAIVWVAMRPLWGIGMLAVALCFIGISVFIGHQHEKPPKRKGRKQGRPLMEGDEEHSDE